MKRVHAGRRSTLPIGRGKRIRLTDGREIALFDIDGTLYAVDNICPHQRAPLIFEGDVTDCIVTCPLHGWRYHLDTGENADDMGVSLKTFNVEEIDGDIYVDVPPKRRPKWMG